ncbi:hypothetical protein ACLOJK_016559 [Asimina triloba]
MKRVYESPKKMRMKNWKRFTRGIVALGKFDALHIGHRELAIQASKAGVPFLLSFVGMAEVLGWEHRFFADGNYNTGLSDSLYRAPIVAKCDRKRVLSSWAPYCGNVIPTEFEVEFANVRHLTPRQFVERLSKELKVSGVVAGENYRFGYKASGDAGELVRLCKEYGLGAYIVNSILDKNQCSPHGRSKSCDLKERGQVSSTRVRHALAEGDMKYVSELLGRRHRLFLAKKGNCVGNGNMLSAPKSCVLNQLPKEGVYEDCTLLVDHAVVGPCIVSIDETDIHLELHGKDGALESARLRDCHLLGIDFGGNGGD